LATLLARCRAEPMTTESLSPTAGRLTNAITVDVERQLPNGGTARSAICDSRGSRMKTFANVQGRWPFQIILEHQLGGTQRYNLGGTNLRDFRAEPASDMLKHNLRGFGFGGGSAMTDAVLVP
jgi:hypothetical protein